MPSRGWLKKPRLQSAIGLFVGVGRPFGKRCEWILTSFGRLIEQDAVVGDAIPQSVAGFQLELFAYFARNYRLALPKPLENKRAGGKSDS